MRDFRELQVWKKSHELTLSMYKATEQFPMNERFGLTSQIRRCAASIPANIAEGCGRVATESCTDSCKLPPDPAANWNITFCSLAT